VPDFRGLRLIEGAGHWVLFEAPEAFDAALLAVLESGGGPPAPKTRAHQEGCA
jgi:hypothetical protein